MVIVRGLVRLSHLLCTPYPQALGVVVLSGLGRETGLALGGQSLESHQGQSWGWEILKLAADPQMGTEGPWCMSQCEEAGREMQQAGVHGSSRLARPPCR